MDSGEPVSGRSLGLATLAAALISLVSLALAAAAGSPYLSSDRVNGWIVVFAFALLALLVAIPFALERRLRARQPDRDKRWERSILIWGGLAAAAVALAVLLGSGAGFSGSSLAGTIALIVALEAGLVVLAVGGWMLSN